MRTTSYTAQANKGSMDMHESEETSNQYLLVPSRIRIVGNRSKWAGDPQDPLPMLFARLEKYPLDPRWES
jgi:hypothetical protein